VKTKPAILAAVRFIQSLKTSGGGVTSSGEPRRPVEYRQIPTILTNAGFHRRAGVLLKAARELESEGKLIIIRRGRSREDWDLDLPEEEEEGKAAVVETSDCVSEKPDIKEL
jgi:hypothetical protein